MRKFKEGMTPEEFDTLFGTSLRTSNEQKWFRGDLLVSYEGNLDSKERTRIARAHCVEVSRLDVWMNISREFPDEDIRAQAPWGVFSELVKLPQEDMRIEVLTSLVEESQTDGRGVTTRDAATAVRRYRKEHPVEIAQAERRRDNKPLLTEREIEKLLAEYSKDGTEYEKDTSHTKGAFWLQGVKVDGTRHDDMIVVDLSESGWVLEHATEHGPLRLVLRKEG